MGNGKKSVMGGLGVDERGKVAGGGKVNPESTSSNADGEHRADSGLWEAVATVTFVTIACVKSVLYWTERSP